MQRYLGSMEGAVLSGKLTAQSISQITVPSTLATSSHIPTLNRPPAKNAATA
jgi:15-cis-phytoene desaturase